MIIATQIRQGNVIRYNGELCRVSSIEHVTPGKGNALIRATMFNIIKGTKIEARYRPSEKVDDVRLEERYMQYLFSEGDHHVFMDQSTFEQISVSISMNEDLKYFLVENAICAISFHDGQPMTIEPPATVELKIVETEPALKGATVAGGLKPAKLETGLTVGVPMYIESGVVIRVDTAQRKYLERVK